LLLCVVDWRQTVNQFRLEYVRARRAASELDKVGGTIGRAAQFAKRDGGLRSPRSAKNEKEISKKACLENLLKNASGKNSGIGLTTRTYR
jgi:hypothetical protein